MKSIDVAGIDLLVWSDEPRIPLAIQCKGYRREEIAADQIRQARTSIEAFLTSGVQVERYVLVHNRDGSNRMREQLEPLLEECRRRGIADTADIWDREHLVDFVFDAVRDEIRTAIRTYSNSIAAHLDALFAFRSARIRAVPVLEQRAVFRRDAPAYLTDAGPKRTGDISQILRQSSGRRWTILTGTFGMGKTTAALTAAHDAETPALFVPVAAIAPEVFRGGIRADLLVHVNELLGVAANDGDSSEAGKSRIAASVLAQLLRASDSDVALILDGLDEHHELATPQGIMRLLNQLADFQGPVVLTTRKEHLDSMFGSFNVAMSGLSVRYGREREARVLHLTEWSDAETDQVVRLAIASSSGETAHRLRRLLELIEAGSARPYYGELLNYPLFLQFILEDVAEYGVRAASRAELLASFVERKIRRDLVQVIPNSDARRAEIAPEVDPEVAVELTFEALGRVAAAMTLRTEDRIALLEDIDGDDVAKIFTETFGRPVDIVAVLLNSVLVTTGPRVGRRLRVAFALRILQEYFLAASIVSSGGESREYPPSIGALVAEMRAQRSPSTTKSDESRRR